MRRPTDREGMALLTVLLLVAVMAAVATALLDDVRTSIRRGANVESVAQARWYALGAEALAKRQIVRLRRDNPSRIPIDPQWNGRGLAFPIEAGEIRAVVRDGQACFNLNSVAEGYGAFLTRRDRGVTQFIALARAAGVPDGQARTIAASLVDWVDADAAPQPGGAEDAVYASRSPAYRTGGVMLSEVSELRAVNGVTPEAYRALRPYVCALPTTDLSPINVNTLTPEQAPLLVMLTEGALSLSNARSVIAQRPRDGWSDAGAFWGLSAFRDFTTPPEVYDQVGVDTRYFDLTTEVAFAGARIVRSALLHAGDDGRVRTVAARWSADE